jgi:DHA1 family bicyclomycin/chloramphenicol resistance-like MFS transporter
LLVPQFAYFAAHGITFPCAQAGAVAPFPRHAGAAAGMFGFLQMVFAGLVGAWIGASYNGTVFPVVLTVAACALLVFVTAFAWIARLARAPVVERAVSTAAAPGDGIG